MNKMNEKEFLETASLEALLLAFANAKPYNKKGYVITSTYKCGDYSPYELNDEISNLNNVLISKYTGLEFTYTHKVTTKQIETNHSFLILSDSNVNDFFQKLYTCIQRRRFEINCTDENFEHILLLVFFIPRGSFDFKKNYYTIDLLKSIIHENYLNNLFKLLTNISDLRQLNLNFRELQGEFVSGKSKRNTQFRIRMNYFYEKVGINSKDINKYKYDTFIKNEKIIKSKTINTKNSDSFTNRFFFYVNRVLNQTKTEREIEQLRKELGFEYDTEINNKVKRNQSIVQYVRVYFPDECAACKQQYDIADRSFKYRDSERYYMEVHHCISFSADNTCDQIDNLVKLCPTCHRALTKNRADETYQRELIARIFDNAPEAKSFCLNFVTSENQLVDFVYERLR